MKQADVIVIGRSAAGMTAAMTARRHYPERSVLLVWREKKVSIPCGIPYAFGIVGSPEKNLMPVDETLARNGIDSVIGDVTSLDRARKIIRTADGGEFSYQRLVLATGSEPLVPPIPGRDKGNIFAIRMDVAYLNQLLQVMDKSRNLCIVGCGFIGVEIAEECKRRIPNMNVCIVEMLTHCLQLVYDDEFCVKAEETLKAQGIDLLLDAKVAAFEGERDVRQVRLADNSAVDADIVILGIGAIPSVSLARDAELDLGSKGGILVNRYMQTSDPAIYACGDCTDKVSFFDGKPSGLKLASIATMEARIAGANLFSTNRVNLGVIGVYATVLDDCAFAAAGLTSAQARDKGYDIATFQTGTHPALTASPIAYQLVNAAEIAIGEMRRRHARV